MPVEGTRGSTASLAGAVTTRLMQDCTYSLAVHSGRTVNRHEHATVVHAVFVVASIFIAHAVLGKEAAETSGCGADCRTGQCGAANRAFSNRTSR
jgi:hypothetical protein